MKHAGPEALDDLEPLLVQLRALPSLTEKSRGCFYRKSRSFLHFHEDPKGLFADMRAAVDSNDFDRFNVTAPAEQAAFVAEAMARLRV